jgi:hypothetical protein
MRVLPRAGVDRHCKVRSSPHYLRKLSFSSTRCGYIYLFTIANMVTADERNCHGLVVPLRTINCCCGLFTGYLFIMLYNDHYIPRGCVSTVQNHDHLYVELCYSLLFWLLPRFATARWVPGWSRPLPTSGAVPERQYGRSPGEARSPTLVSVRLMHFAWPHDSDSNWV